MTERRKTVLIVDSDDAIRERLAAVLRHDYRVLKAANGESALSIMGTVTIDIEDTGCGIATERLATIFDDFTTTRSRGLGLGLAIAKRIVEQSGGTIQVRSTVGVGTTFTVRFNAALEQAQRAAS